MVDALTDLEESDGFASAKELEYALARKEERAAKKQGDVIRGIVDAWTAMSSTEASDAAKEAALASARNVVSDAEKEADSAASKADNALAALMRARMSLEYAEAYAAAKEEELVAGPEAEATAVTEADAQAATAEAHTAMDDSHDLATDKIAVSETGATSEASKRRLSLVALVDAWTAIKDLEEFVSGKQVEYALIKKAERALRKEADALAAMANAWTDTDNAEAPAEAKELVLATAKNVALAAAEQAENAAKKERKALADMEYAWSVADATDAFVKAKQREFATRRQTLEAQVANDAHASIADAEKAMDQSTAEQAEIDHSTVEQEESDDSTVEQQDTAEKMRNDRLEAVIAGWKTLDDAEVLAAAKEEESASLNTEMDNDEASAEDAAKVGRHAEDALAAMLDSWRVLDNSDEKATAKEEEAEAMATEAEAPDAEAEASEEAEAPDAMADALAALKAASEGLSKTS